MKAAKPSLQHGPVGVLEQTRWWFTNSKGWVKRKDMDVSHKAATLSWLIRHADNIVGNYVMSPVFYSAPDEVQGELDYMMQEPVLYILRTDFVRALIKDLFKQADMTPVDLGMRLVDGAHRTMDGYVVKTWLERVK